MSKPKKSKRQAADFRATEDSHKRNLEKDMTREHQIIHKEVHEKFVERAGGKPPHLKPQD